MTKKYDPIDIANAIIYITNQKKHPIKFNQLHTALYFINTIYAIHNGEAFLPNDAFVKGDYQPLNQNVYKLCRKDEVGNDVQINNQIQLNNDGSIEEIPFNIKSIEISVLNCINDNLSLFWNINILDVAEQVHKMPQFKMLDSYQTYDNKKNIEYWKNHQFWKDNNYNTINQINSNVLYHITNPYHMDGHQKVNIENIFKAYCEFENITVNDKEYNNFMTFLHLNQPFYNKYQALNFLSQRLTQITDSFLDKFDNNEITNIINNIQNLKTKSNKQLFQINALSNNINIHPLTVEEFNNMI